MRNSVLILALAAAGCDCGQRLRKLESELEAPARVDFGRVTPGTPVERRATFRNRGEVDLALESFVLNPSNHFSVNGFTSHIATGDAVELQLHWTAPAVLGLDSAVLEVSAQGYDQPLRVELVGEVVEGLELPPDGGGPDGGQPDSGAPDGGTPDAGPPPPRLDGGNSSCLGAGDVFERVLGVSDAGYQSNPFLLVTNTGWAVAWEDGPVPASVNQGPHLAKGSRLDPWGVALQPSAVLMPGTPANARQIRPQLAWNGQNFASVVLDSRGGSASNYFTILDSALVPLGANPPTGVPYQSNPAEGFPGVAWNAPTQKWATLGTIQPVSTRDDLVLRLWSATDSTSIPPPIPVGGQVPFSQYGRLFGLWGSAAPAFISTPRGFAVTAYNNFNSGMTMVGISHDGGTEFVSPNHGITADIWRPSSTATNGTELAGLWMEWTASGRRVKLLRTDLFGNSLGPVIDVAQFPGPAIMAGVPEHAAGVVWAGSSWLVTWVEFENSDTVAQVWVTQYSPQGIEVVGARRKLTCSTDSNNYPALAFNGSFAGMVVARGTPYMQQRLVFLGFNPK